MRIPHAIALQVSLVLLAFAPARAQCPDGSPPPCRSATPAQAAAPRRVNPPLDDRTWIVVPFDNLAKAPDVDWLRNAAVNLLYLDMSRWTDVRVVDDERVADLLREVPEATAQQLSLNAGLAVARRAGAGKLVMGDVLKVGNRTAITAKIYDVRSGQRLRSVREETAVADSVMPIFGRLARRILNVAPPRNANVGALGTQSAEAYQEYVAGLEALNRYDLSTARQRFDQAIRRDSTFALAHYKQSIVLGWENATDPNRRTHAEAANRLSAGLPPRERSLIIGQLQQTTGDWAKACETYQGLTRADSMDVEAWYGIGECLFHDPTIEAVGGDTTRLRFRADYHGSIRAFERALRLDPTYHLAYQHIIDALTSERHPNVCHSNNPAARCTAYGAFLVRLGDSLVASPASIARDTAKLRQQGELFVQTSSRRRNLELARAFAEAWVQASPTEPQAHRALARVLVLQGEVEAADAELAQVRTPGTHQEQLRQWLERMEVEYKLGRGANAIRVYDSARASTALLPNATFSFGNAIAGYAPAFGRLVEFDSLLAVNMRSGNAPEFIQRYQRYAVRSAVSGVPHDSLVAAERETFDQSVARGASFATRSIAGSLMYSLRAPRTQWPAIDTTLRDVRLRPAIALSRGDTAGVRAAAQALDSLAAALASAGVADSGFSVVAAEAYLAVRDTAAALRSTRVALDRSSASTPYFPQSSPGMASVYFVPRAMLLRADLAAATGQREEARTWYRRFIDVWSTAVPEFQPLVERARKALAALGTSS
jgi:tetratricopeptide (TPR) repeat protein/TolB-like protein